MGSLLWFALHVLAVTRTIAAAQSGTSPISVPPSEYWEGDDGSWSTFDVQLGSPAQVVRLLPGTSATASNAIWAIIPEGCSLILPNDTRCPDSRGRLFQRNASTTWSTQSLPPSQNGSLFALSLYEEASLGMAGNGYYGFDTVGLGLPGSGLPVLSHQPISGIATADFWLGSLGLSPYPLNFTNFDSPKPSLVGYLRNQSVIPSSSWAYTAGAYYSQPTTFGSLTLGGYDASRFTPNNLSIPFGPDISRDLVVGLRSITVDTVGAEPLMSSNIDMFIDSLVSEIWLPISVCREFERQFNITWNSTFERYIVDNNQHQALKSSGATIKFTLGLPGPSGNSSWTTDLVEIDIPYAGFDQNISQAIGSSTPLRYFPLRQAQNSSQYTFGRTFLQQSYLIADYERRQFSVSKALFPSAGTGQQLVAIVSPQDNVNPAPVLTKGDIAAVVIGCLIVLTAAIVGFLWLRRYLRRRKQDSFSEYVPVDPKDPYSQGSSPEIPFSPLTPELYGEVKRHEIDTARVRYPELSADGRAIRYEMQAPNAMHEAKGDWIWHQRAELHGDTSTRRPGLGIEETAQSQTASPVLRTQQDTLIS